MRKEERLISNKMVMSFRFNEKFLKEFKYYEDQRVVSYKCFISENKSANDKFIDDSFFADSCNSSYCEYIYAPSPEEYKDVPNSAGDMAREMIRGFCSDP